MVVKVKEPLAEEYDFLREDLLLFTYLHMAAAPELADAMVCLLYTSPVVAEIIRAYEPIPNPVLKEESDVEDE